MNAGPAVEDDGPDAAAICRFRASPTARLLTQAPRPARPTARSGNHPGARGRRRGHRVWLRALRL